MWLKHQEPFYVFLSKTSAASPALLNYRAMDPSLSDKEVQLYERAERRWQRVMHGLTPEDTAVLKRRIHRQVFRLRDIAVLEAPLKKDVLSPIAVTSSRGPFAASIILDAERPDRYKIPQNEFWILGHELMHVFHIMCRRINPTAYCKGEKTDDMVTEMYRSIRQAAKGEISEGELQAKLTRVIKTGKSRELKKAQKNLRSEAIAYRVDADILKRFHFPDNQYQGAMRMSQGFQTAIALINEQLYS